MQRFKSALREYQVGENISDRSKKQKKAAFFVQAIERMEELLDRELCHDIRDACACSKGGWRLKAMQKIAKECEGQSVEQNYHHYQTALGKRLRTQDVVSSALESRGKETCRFVFVILE